MKYRRISTALCVLLTAVMISLASAFAVSAVTTPDIPEFSSSQSSKKSDSSESSSSKSSSSKASSKDSSESSSKSSSSKASSKAESSEVSSEAQREETVSQAAAVESGGGMFLYIGIACWFAMLVLVCLLVGIIIRRRKKPRISPQHRDAEIARKDERYSSQHYRRY